MELVNCLFLANIGIALVSSDVRATPQGTSRLYNCTFHLNDADEPGSIYSSQELIAWNCIFWDGEVAFINTDDESQDVRYCTATNATVIDGEGNNNCDPGLDADGVPNAGNDVAVDSGEDDLLPQDWFDIDGVEQTYYLPQDLVNSDRVIGGKLDRGAFELTHECICPADINNTGTVNTDDLMFVIGGWGACASPPTPCPGDVVPVCAGDGQVNTDDLTLVIGSWGACPGPSCESQNMMMQGGGGAQEAIQGCIDAAIENGLDGFEFALFIQQCIDDLCKKEIIECGE